MSSRNQRLTKNGFKKAANLFKILSQIRLEIIKNPNNIKKIIASAKENLLKKGFEKIDYLEIRTEENLTAIDEIKNLPTKDLRIFAAVYLENIRLIDNLKI